jgi:hypothetical protein
MSLKSKQEKKSTTGGSRQARKQEKTDDGGLDYEKGKKKSLGETVLVPTRA